MTGAVLEALTAADLAVFDVDAPDEHNLLKEKEKKVRSKPL